MSFNNYNDRGLRSEWMTTESLAEFLDPNDSSKTLEGYPAPLRAVIIATKPETQQSLAAKEKSRMIS